MGAVVVSDISLRFIASWCLIFSEFRCMPCYRQKLSPMHYNYTQLSTYSPRQWIEVHLGYPLNSPPWPPFDHQLLFSWNRPEQQLYLTQYYDRDSSFHRNSQVSAYTWISPAFRSVLSALHWKGNLGWKHVLRQGAPPLTHWSPWLLPDRPPLCQPSSGQLNLRQPRFQGCNFQ